MTNLLHLRFRYDDKKVNNEFDSLHKDKNNRSRRLSEVEPITHVCMFILVCNFVDASETCTYSCIRVYHLQEKIKKKSHSSSRND